MPPPEPLRTGQRADGTEAREKLLLAALRLFADRGFAKTSTRDIAREAGVNVASIAYYFGDKAGLYRATLTEPMGGEPDGCPVCWPPGASLEHSLGFFYREFLAPLARGEITRQCLRLYYREMFEPSGVDGGHVDDQMGANVEALLDLLRGQFGLAPGFHDAALRTLALSLCALGLNLYVLRDLVTQRYPDLLADEAALAETVGRLTELGVAMVRAEAARRMGHATPGVARSNPSFEKSLT
jgi:AcrR family transcriptional regulator